MTRLGSRNPPQPFCILNISPKHSGSDLRLGLREVFISAQEDRDGGGAEHARRGLEYMWLHCPVLARITASGQQGRGDVPLFPELEGAARGWLTSLPAQLTVFFVLSEIFYF